MKSIQICLLLCSIHIVAFSQNERFKSLFVYNFTKNIEWPLSYSQGDFVITVLGNSAIYTELQQNVKGKTIGNQTIQVTHASSLSNLERCNMLYISAQQSDLIEATIKQLNGKPTVIVTEKHGMIRRGSDIDIIQSGGKLQFEINPKQLENKDIKVSKTLLNLGIIHEAGSTRRMPKLESINDSSMPR